MLEVQNNLLNIAPFLNQASLLQKELNQNFLKLVGEMYKVKQIEARLKEIAQNVAEIWKNFFDVA